MSAAIQDAISRLKRSAVYHRLRVSPLHDLYLNMKDRKLAKSREREADFYRGILNRFESNDLVFEIGANVGDKVDTLLRGGARVVAVDPDENNQAIMQQRFLRYRFKPKAVTIVGKAVGATAGIATMLVCAPGSVFNTLSKKGACILGDADYCNAQSMDQLQYQEKRIVETTTLDDLIDTYGVPALIKIDVVGFELEVIQGLHRPVPCLSFEISLPEFRQELLQCIEILGRLSPRGQFNYTWDHRNGLVLDDWIDTQKFVRVLEDSGEGPLEVFWRNPNLYRHVAKSTR